MTAGVDLEDERIVIGAQKIFDGIENRMSLIHRTSDQAPGREHVYGYEGTYRVNPKLLEALKIAASDWRFWMGECGTHVNGLATGTPWHLKTARQPSCCLGKDRSI